MARTQEEVIELWVEYIQLQKLFITIHQIKKIRGKTELLGMLNDFGVTNLSAVLRELISHYYPTGKDKDAIVFEFNGKDITVKEFYRLCCEVVHINVFANPKLPENFLHKISFIGAKLYEKCDKNDPRIKKCIELPHHVNHELANLYSLQPAGKQTSYR